ncbi:MAG: ribosome maturation factor RimM [Lachnospiraceae bacterium]|jgi:16S rRNA processing protein RimM|nr:ribosome maturation factor RimM [Lachnospiraceae bacterium]
MTERFQIGEIAGTHGIKGDVKVFPTTDDPTRFKRLKRAFLETRDGLVSVECSGAKMLGRFVSVHIKGYESIDDARLLKGRKLYVDRKDAIELPEGSWFIPDLVGMQVETDEGEILGELTEVIQTGANDVYGVTREDGKEVLIPAIKECILDVNVDEGTMKVHLLKGLLDL